MLPKRYRVAYTKKVNKQLTSIFAFISRTAPETAADVIRQIMDACDALEMFPRRGKPLRSRAIRGEVRQTWVLTYRIRFSISESTDTVTIHGVQHGSRKRWY